MSKVSKNVVAQFVASLTTSGDVIATMVYLDNLSIVKLGELCGFNSEDDTLRDNRGRQNSTDKLLDILSEDGRPRWNPNVGMIYVRSNPDKLPAIVNGGNTFRAIYWHLQGNPDDTIPVTLLYSTSVDFGAFDQIGKDRTNQSNLADRFKDGWENYYSELFGLSCLRVKGKGVGGGGNDKRTWEGKIYYPDQLANSNSSIFDMPWFYSLYYLGIAEDENLQSIFKLGQTISEKMPKFKDIHIAYLLMAVVDCLGSIENWVTEEMEDGTIVSKADTTLGNAIRRISDNLDKGISLLQPIFSPTIKGVSYKAEAKYSALVHFVQCCVEGNQLPKVLKSDKTPPIGASQAYEKFCSAYPTNDDYWFST